MFGVYILVCISNATDCTELVDTSGPYETRAEFLNRAIEMREETLKNVKYQFLTNA